MPLRLVVRIDVDKLAAHGLKLCFDSPEHRRLVELGPSGAVTGYYQYTEEGHRVRAGASHALALTNLEWETGHAKLVLTSNAKLEKPRVDLTFPAGKAGATGRIGATRLTAATLELWLPHLGDHPIELRGLEARDVALELRDGALTLQAAGIDVEAIELEAGRVSIAAGPLRLGAGFRWSNGRLAVDSGQLVALAVRVADVAALTRRSAAAPSVRTARKSLDLRWLDHLDGKLAVDVTVDATIKAIGRRKATHVVRLPIRGGTINFEKLEHSLARLEDSVLDFVVEGDTLQLVKDVPLVPFDRKTLVYWQLSRSEQQLARDRRVLVRRLLDYRLPTASKRKSPDAKPAIRLRSLHFDPIRAELRLRGGTQLSLGQGARIMLGDERRAAVSKLAVTGRLHHDERGKRRSTTLSATVGRSCAAVKGLAVGGTRIDASAFTVGAIDSATVTFRGLTPGQLDAAASQIKVTNLSVSFGE